MGFVSKIAFVCLIVLFMVMSSCHGKPQWLIGGGLIPGASSHHGQGKGLGRRGLYVETAENAADENSEY